MKRKYQTLVTAANAAGYPRLRALSKKVGDRKQWRSHDGFADACDRRGLAIVDLIDNHGFSLAEIARLLDITDTSVGRVYNIYCGKVKA